MSFGDYLTCNIDCEDGDGDGDLKEEEGEEEEPSAQSLTEVYVWGEGGHGGGDGEGDTNPPTDPTWPRSPPRPSFSLTLAFLLPSRQARNTGVRWGVGGGRDVWVVVWIPSKDSELVHFFIP